MLLEGENSDDDFFQYKITHKDWEILQQAKLQEGVNPELFANQDQFGLMEENNNQFAPQINQGAHGQNNELEMFVDQSN